MQRSVLQHLQAVALEVLTCAAHSPLYRGEGVAPEVHLITLPERLKQQLQLDFFCCIFDLCVHRGIHTLPSENSLSMSRGLARYSFAPAAVHCSSKGRASGRDRVYQNGKN